MEAKEYEGFRVVPVPQSALLALKPKSGVLPKTLAGHFTGMGAIKKAVEAHKKAKTPSKSVNG